MGVDCAIRLPGNVTLDNVTKAIGIIAGLKPTLKEFHDGKYVTVPGATYSSGSAVPEMASIRIAGCVDGKIHHANYHFEAGEDCRLISCRSSPFWIAVGRRLVDFFGGSIDYADCDASDNDYSVPPKTVAENAPEDGPEWDRFQDRLLDLKPLTEAEIAEYEQYAAYT